MTVMDLAYSRAKVPRDYGWKRSLSNDIVESDPGGL